MFVPTKINLTVYRGSTFRSSFSVKTKNQLGVLVPLDLTGWSARMQIRESVDSPSVIVDLTTSNGGIIITVDKDSNGVLLSSIYTIYIKDTATDAFNIESGVYDIELISPDVEVGRIQSGTVKVIPSVTR